MLDQRYLKIIKAIASTKSISKAAELLYISQPSLSRNLKRIENELSFQLFDRTKTPLQLTPQGELYVAYLEKMMLLEGEFKAKLYELTNSKPQQLIVSAHSFFSIPIYPKVIPLFIQRYPQVTFILKDYSHSDYETALLQGDVDLFLALTKPKHPQLQYHTIRHDEFYLMCNRTAELERKYDLSNNSPDNPFTIDLHDVKDETFYLLEQNMNVRQAAEAIFQKNHFTPKKTVVIPNMVGASSIVNGGKGATFISRSALSYVTLSDSIVLAKCDGSEELLSITAVYKDAPKNKWIQYFCQIVEEVFTKSE